MPDHTFPSITRPSTSSQALTIILGNRNPEFDPTQSGQPVNLPVPPLNLPRPTLQPA